MTLTDQRVKATSFGLTIWQVCFSEIVSIQVTPKVLGASVAISAADGTGFLFLINDSSALIEALKPFKLPISYDEKSVAAEARRFKFASNPIVLCVGVLVGVAFIWFIIKNILQY